MAESRKIQIEAEMSAAGVKQGAQEIKQTVSDMASAVSQEAGRAGQAVGKIGDGGEQTSQKVDRATRSMIASIQRMTAQMEAGSRTNTKYWETLAQQRGVDVEALKPYLAQLEEVRLKQGQAAAAASAGAIEFNKYGMSARQLQAALRGVPAQLTDIVVSLQGGQRPLTVLLQQGGQLRDLFGGIVPAAQALGTTLLKMVNPMTLAAGAAVGLYAAYRAGASETENFQRTLLMTGNAAGVTADQLNVMAERVSRSIGTQRQAAAALNEFARSGKIAATEFERFSAAAVQWEKATGSAISETVKQFEELSKAPLEASLKLNDSMNYLTESTYRQIKALQEAGRETDAASLAQRAFSDAIHERAPGIVSQVGTIERAWHAVKGAISGAAGAMMAIGRPETVESLNTQLQAKLAQLRALQEGPGFADTGGGAAVGGTRGGSRAAEGVIANEARLLAAEVQMLMQEMTAAQLALQRKKELEQAVYRDSYLGDSSRQTQAEQRAAAIKAEQDAFKKAVVGLSTDSKEYERIYAAHKTALLNIDKQFEEKRSGGISATQTELARMRAALEAERQREAQLHSSALALANLNEFEKQAIQYGEKLKLVTDAKTRSQLQELKVLAEETGARRRANDEFEKDQKARQSAIDAAKKQTQQLRDEIETYGMGKSAIEAMTIARLEERLAVDEALGASAGTIEVLRQEIAARKELLSNMRTKEQLDAQLREWQSWEREVDRIFDQLGQSLTDQLFEGGKSARDMLKDMFKALTLRVVVQPMMAGLQGMVTQQIGGLLGFSDPRQQGGGILGTAQNLYSGYNAITGGLNSTLGNAAQWLGQKIGSEALTSFGLGLSGTTAATGIASIGAGLGASLGTSIGASAAAMTTTSFSAALSGGALVPGLGVGAAGGGVGAGIGAAGAAGGAAAGGGAASAGAAFGAALPWIGGALAIGSILGGGLFDREPTTRREQRTQVEYSGGSLGVTQTDDRAQAGADQAVAQMTAAAIESANSLFRQIGIDAAIDSFHAILASSYQGDRDGVASGGRLRIGDRLVDIGIPDDENPTIKGFGGWSSAETLPRLATDIQLTVLEAFQAASDQLPSVLATMLADVDVRSLGEAEAQALAERFTALTQGASAFLATLENTPFAELRDLSFDAAAAMVQFAGSVDNLLSAQQTYYDRYYSEQEKFEHSVNQLSQALSGVGVVMPELTGSTDDMLASYRRLVESLDLNTEAGQHAYVVLMQSAGAFADVAQYAGQAASAVEGAARSLADIARERESLERQWLQINGQTEELRRRELEGIDESNRALQRLIWARQDEMEAAERAAQEAQQAWQQALSDLGGAYTLVQQAAQAEIQRLQQTFGATDTAYRAAQQAAQSIERDLAGIINGIGRVVRDLRGEVDATARMQYDRARAVISTALVTGQLPQTADLTEAMDIARRGVADAVYASRVEQERAYLRLANELEQLQAIAEPELDTAQRTLRELQRQYETLRGISGVAEGSLDVLRAQFAVAVAAEEAARVQIAGIETQLDWAKAQYEQLQGIHSGVTSFPEAIENLGNKLVAAIAALAAVQAPPLNSSGGSSGDDAYFEAKLAHLKATGSQRDGINWAYATVNDLKAYFDSLNLTPLEHWEKWGKDEGLPRPSFAVGTAFVPYDMTADIHAREAVIDARSMDILRTYGIRVQAAGSQELVAEIRALREQNAQLRAELTAIARATEQMADQIDRVSAGGNANAAEIMNGKELAKDIAKELAEVLA